MARSAASNRPGVQPYTTSTSFNGTSTFLTKTTPTGLPTGTTSRSISGRIWLNDPAFPLGVIGMFKVTGAQSPAAILGFSGGSYVYAFDVANGGNALTLTSAQFRAAFKPRQWHHAVWEFTNTTVTLYVDNVLVKSEAWAVAMNTGTYSSLFFGKGTDNAGSNIYFFNGCMKDMRVHNGVMTAQQRENEYLFGSVSSTVVSRFLMEDGMAATTVADSVGSNTLTGTALTWQARNVPTAARRELVNQTGSPRLNGSTGYIDFGSHATYNLGTSGAFECEFFLDALQVDTSAANSRFLICIDNGASTNWMLLAVTNTGAFQVALDLRKASVSTALLTTAPYGTGLLDSRWHKVAVNWNASGAWIVLDGALAAMNAVDMTTPLTGTPAMVSGRLGAGFNLRYLTGMTRNFKLMSSATIAEAQASYLYNKPYANLVAAWDCNTIGGTVVPLTSGTGNAGTLTGGVTVVKDTPLKPRQVVNKNLVYNGDFEIKPAFTAVTTTASRWVDGTAAGSTTNDVPGWATVIAGTTAASFDTSVFHGGLCSLKLSTLAAASNSFASTVRAPTTASQILANGFTVLASTSYTLTFWMKTLYGSGDSNDGCYLRIQEYTRAGASITSTDSTPKVKTTTDWTQYSIVLTTSATTSFLRVEPRVTGNSGAATLVMDAWFDDIVLTPTTPVARLAA